MSDRYIVPAMSMTNAEDRGPAAPWERIVLLESDHVEALDAAVEATRSRAYTLMGAAIQNGIDAERKRIRLSIAALVDGDVIDLSLREYRAVVEVIDEEES